MLVSERFGALEFLESTETIHNFQFDPLNTQELATKIIQYLEGNGSDSNYFKNLYDANFSSERTFNSFKQVIQ